MRRLILCITALALFLPTLAQAYDVLVLQSRRDAAYDEVLRGFQAVRGTSQRVIVLTDYSEVNAARLVREDHPRLVLAIGDAAVRAVREIRQTPVIAVMSLAIHNKKSLAPAVSAIGMFAPPGRYVDLFRKLKVRRVGVIYHDAKTGWYMRDALEAARNSGIELVIREVRSPREVSAQLASLNGKVDALWMLPDSTAVTRETSEAWFRFGQEHHLPVISFATAYLGLGAAAVIDIDRAGLGKQAGEIAGALLENRGVVSANLIYPDITPLKTNSAVLNRLGLEHAR